MTTIQVCDTQGSYFNVDAEEIIRAARAVAQTKMATGDFFTDPNTARNFFSVQLSGLDREVFGVAFLNTRHQLIKYEELFFGTIDGAEVHPREIVKAALNCNAAAVILTHNHPSDNPEPSAADRAVTSRIKQSLALVDVRVLDHIIVARTETVSMAEKGLI